MHRRLTHLTPHLPAALLLLFSGWAGTFSDGARGEWALAGHLALWLFAGVMGDLRPDPLRLGVGGRWLLIALALSVLASHLASPVMRAGRLGILLLPAFALVPSAVARCWSSHRARRAGLRSVSLVVGVVAVWSLYGWWWLDTPGASLPLGHHNLLAAWFLVLLPLAVLPWRDGGVGRVIAVGVGVAGLAALVGTRSFAAVLAVGVVAGVLLARRRVGWWGLAAVAPLLATQLPRMNAVLRGTDTSAAARWSYLQAGWHAFLERPMLGWGPGAGRWTLAEHLRPIPGIHVPDQVVADPHSLPVLIGYELGLSGLLLISGLVLTFVRSRPASAVDPALRRCALLGLGALAIMSLAGRPLAVSAIPLAMMIGIGAILAAEAPPMPRGGAPRRAPRIMAGLLAVTVLAALVAPLDLAHLAYDRALRAESHGQRMRHLQRAVELDPAFPLYRARLAWLDAGREQRPGAEAAGRARAAAEDARGVAPLWLVAGILGQEAGDSWSLEALLRACRLSPLGVIAPYRLTFEDSSATERVHWTARALLAEPLVLAAVAWDDRESVLRAAVDEIGRLEGVEAGWHAWLEQILDVRLSDIWQGENGTSRQLALGMDGESATSPSLFAFRRQPWPVDLARIEVDETMLEYIDPGASGLPHAAIVGDELCGVRGVHAP